jgi:hypothetical protein
MVPDNDSDHAWLHRPCRRNDDDGTDELVRSSLTLLKEFARAYANRGKTIENLQQVAAYLALSRPIDRSGPREDSSRTMRPWKSA